jgi:hypothetical protein
LSHAIAAIIRNKNYFDYAIVEEGCFSALTALALIQKWPDTQIFWFERTYTHTALQDKSNIICAAYKGKGYIAFVERTLEMWQADLFYKEHYHQTRWV